MQSKRLGLFLGLGCAGVVFLLGGLSWDAVLHAHDPGLAAQEGIFAYRNPGHVLLGAGMAAVIVGLLGSVSTVLAASGNPRWARPAVQRAFVVGSAALVLAAASITSWSATVGHDESVDHADLASFFSPDGGHTGTDTHGPPGAKAGQAARDLAGATHADAASHGDPAKAAHTNVADAALIGVGHGHVTDPEAAAKAAARSAQLHDHVTPGNAPAATTASAHAHPATGPSATPSGEPSAPGHSHESPPANNATHDPGATGTPAGELTVLRYGPFLPSPASAGGELDPGNVALPNVAMPCTNCYITYAEPDLVFADGSSANYDRGVMLHHAVFFNTGKKDTTCGSDEFLGGLGERFLASGNERTIKRLPDGFAYQYGDEPVNAIFHIMNHSDMPQNVFFQWKFRWLPADAPGIKEVTPVWLDMENCRTSEYDVPAGPQSKHRTWTSNITGHVVATGGHVHDGGIRTTLRNQTTGGHLCTSWASYGTKPSFMGSLESMSRCTWNALGTVKTGDVLDLETIYNSTTPVPGAMGIMVAYVYQTPDLPIGGTPPPSEVTGDTPQPAYSKPPEHAGHAGH